MNFLIEALKADKKRHEQHVEPKPHQAVAVQKLIILFDGQNFRCQVSRA